MSLAMFAAPFDKTDNMNSSSENIIQQKRQVHNKTQKMYAKEPINKEKVNSVLQQIHNNLEMDEDDEYEYDKYNKSFNPPPFPESAGVHKTKPFYNIEGMTNNNIEGMTNNDNNDNNIVSINDVTIKPLGKAPAANYQQKTLELNDYKNYNDSTNAEYYKNIVPNNNNNIGSLDYSTQDVVLQKLNYMITLLEEKQDERTNNVIEEVILYSFLGIFIIFIADTFMRAGKYVR